ncbi:5340_t:CDS:2, partial [Entrophospora sp. SA101]
FKINSETNSIMFLEQLSILEGRFLLNWHAIKHKSFTCNSTCIPKWYKILQPIVLESNDGSNFLKPQFITHNIQNLKGQSITYPNLNTQSQDWVVIWNPMIQNPIFGKIIEKRPNYNQIIIEHWIINNIFSTTDIPIIQKCNVINTKKISAYKRSLNYTIADLYAKAKFVMEVNLDGSLTNLGTHDISMVCAYIQTHTAAPQLQFTASL